MVVRSFVPVPLLGHFATTYLNPMDSGSILDFYYLHFFLISILILKTMNWSRDTTATIDKRIT